MSIQFTSASHSEKNEIINLVRTAHSQEKFHYGLTVMIKETPYGVFVTLIDCSKTNNVMLKQAVDAAHERFSKHFAGQLVDINVLRMPTNWLLEAQDKDFSEDSLTGYLVSNGGKAPTATAMQEAKELRLKGIGFASIARSMLAEQKEPTKRRSFFGTFFTLNH